MANAEQVENTTNFVNLISSILRQQQPFMKILIGNAQFVGSLADLIENNNNNNTVANNDYSAKFYDDIFGDDILLSNILNFWSNANYSDTIDTISYFFNPLDLRYKQLSDILKNINTNLNNFSNSTITLYDPLTLDLNSDEAISTTNLENGVYFNHNGDKIAFKTTWNYQ